MKTKRSKVGKRQPVVLSRGELRILIAGIFVVCILSMILGFVMGRGFKGISSEVSLNDEIDIISPDTRDGSMEEETSLTFFKTLPDDENEKEEKDIEDKKIVPPLIKSKKVLSDQVKIDPIRKKLSNRIEDVAANKKDIPGHGYTIQVSSFRDESQALDLKTTLKKKGYDVHIKSVEIPERGVWYRVFVGVYNSKKDAEKAAKKIHFEEKLPTLVTEQ
ncbi:MAG: SPOR domain-containing protein [Nitrospinota bacterium]